MNKNNKNLLIVAGVFVVLAGVWFATRTSAPSAGVKTLAVKTIAKDAVTRLTIDVPGKDVPRPDAPAAPGEHTADSHVVIEKEGASWVVYAKDAPTKRFAVEQSQLDAVLDAVGEFVPGDRVSSKADKLKDFELDDAQAAHITIATADGVALDLLFGRAAKNGGTTVREADSNDVFVAKGRLGSLVRKDLGQWRRKSVTGKKADDFTAVTVANTNGTTLTVTATTEAPPPPAEGADPTTPPPPPKKTWALTAPSTLPAGFRLDAMALSRLAASLASLRASDFADGVSDDVAGLAAAHTVVTGTLTDGGKVVLHLGAVDDKKRVYARVDGDTQLYLVPEYSAKNLDKAVDDLRDASLFSTTASDVIAATFSSGKMKVTVKKGADDSFVLVEPKKAPAEFDIAQATAVIGSAVRAKGSRVVLDATDIGPSDTSIELTLADGKKQLVRFGKAEGNEVLVRGADGLVYVANASAGARYEKPLELFKKPPPPPQGGMGGGMGGMGGMQGLESLPPDVRAKLEASLKAQGMGN